MLFKAFGDKEGAFPQHARGAPQNWARSVQLVSAASALVCERRTVFVATKSRASSKRALLHSSMERAVSVKKQGAILFDTDCCDFFHVAERKLSAY